MEGVKDDLSVIFLCAGCLLLLLVLAVVAIVVGGA